MIPAAPSGWTFTATTFNWTRDIARAEKPPTDIAAEIGANGLAAAIEIEAGQMLRSFPAPSSSDCNELRQATAAAGVSISIVGLSIDDFHTREQRRSPDERLGFLLPQLHAARLLGAKAVRLPIGQAGPELLRRVQPVLHEHGLILYEEFQGQQTPERISAAVETIENLNDPRIRLLLDTSLLMQALPTSYLEIMARSGLDKQLLERLTEAWLDPETMDAVRATLADGRVPPGLHTLYMNLLIRFGRSPVEQILDLLPLIGAFHAKFWDLDDADGRVSGPLQALGTALAGSGFTGTVCSEWGGHEWLEAEDATEMTRDHLALLRDAMGAGTAGGIE